MRRANSQKPRNPVYSIARAARRPAALGAGTGVVVLGAARAALTRVGSHLCNGGTVSDIANCQKVEKPRPQCNADGKQGEICENVSFERLLSWRCWLEVRPKLPRRNVWVTPARVAPPTF